MEDENKKYPIAERNYLYWDEIRNPELAECSEEIIEICHKYGIMNIEFEGVIESVRASLFNFVEHIDTDDDEEETEGE